MNFALVCVTMGCVLIVAGIGLVVYEMLKPTRTKAGFNFFNENLRPLPLQVRLHTKSSGIVLICIGAVLLLVGMWKG